MPRSVNEIDNVRMTSQYSLLRDRLIFDSESRICGKTCHDVHLLFDVAQHRFVRDGYSLEDMVRRSEYWLCRSDEVDVRETT